MSAGWIPIDGDAGSFMLLIADHASNYVPEGVDLGVPSAMMTEHVAIDIGVAPLAQALCATLGCPGVLGGVSRLVIDLNSGRATVDGRGAARGPDGNPIQGGTGGRVTGTFTVPERKQ